MRALDPQVREAIWAAVEPLLPVPEDDHPLGCHRPRASDRDCFDVIYVRLSTGCSYEDAERLCGNKVSDTTVRSRRDEWIAAGVFEAIVAEALGAYDRIIGLDFSNVALDGSLHKSPCGGEGTGKNPTDRAKLGWKWSILTDKNGIPFAWATEGANRHDSVLLAPTLDRGRAAWSGRRDRNALARSRLRLERDDRALGRAEHRRRGDRQEAQEELGWRKGQAADGASLAGRANELVVVELRPASPQHGQEGDPPARSALPRRHLPAHCKARRLEKPLVTGDGAYPLRLL